MTPKNIKVTSHGNVFVATYQVDAKVKAPGEDEMTERMTRGTLVWSKTDDGLKVVHWHISEPVSED